MSHHRCHPKHCRRINVRTASTPKNAWRTLGLGLGFSLGLSACQLIQPEATPEINVGQQISDPAQYGLDLKSWQSKDWKVAAPSASLPKGEWWQVFKDPQLNQLMQQLNRENASIAQYEAQYRQALSMIDQAQSARWPSLGVTPAMSRGKTQQLGSSVTETQYRVSSTASWEPDLWGKVRQNILVNQRQAKASQAELNNIRLSMQAQLSSTYLQWVVQSFELKSQQKSLKNDKQTLQMTQNQYKAGTVASTAVDQAQSQYQTTAASVTDLELSQVQLQHAMAMLIGQPQDQFQLTVPRQLPILPQIPSSIPSQILQRRPDVAAAAESMAAANAQVGVARLAYFPDFNLAASIGFQGGAIRQLLSAPNLIWSVGPTLAASLFDGGLRRAQTAEAKAAYEASAASYKQTVLGAIQNVEDQIAAQALLSKQAQQQQTALNAALRAENSVMNQYKAGVIAYLDVMTAQNNRAEAQSAVWTLRNRQYQTTVGLIRALGGQWE